MKMRVFAHVMSALMVLGLVAFPAAFAAETKTWDFSTASDYSFNGGEIQIINGSATLVQLQSGSYPETATIATKTGLRYEDLSGFSAQTTGMVRFQVSPNGATWYALKLEGSGWEQNQDTGEEDTDSASDLNLMLPTFADEFETDMLYVRAILYEPAEGQSAPTITGMTVEYIAQAGQTVTTTVDITNFKYSPENKEITIGDTVMWTNKDTATHTVTSDTDKFNSTNLEQNETFSYTFTKAGVYPYHCAVHPTMKGTITVKEKDGSVPKTPTQCFIDVATNHADSVAICELKTRGIVSGIDGKSFFPNSVVRRGEAFKIALAGRDVSAYAHAENPFVDLSDNHTLKPWVLYLFHNGVISGYDATHVGPDNSLTEAEAAKVILNLNGIATAQPPTGETYGLPADSNLIPYVHTALFKNLMRGGRTGFQYNRGMTRGKVATMMYRVLKMNEAGASVYTE